MFGTIFKNSKWGNFETSNLQLKFKNKYFSFQFRFIVFIALVLAILYKRYLNGWDLSGTACLAGWMLFETIDYFFVFIVWLYLFIFYAVLNWMYTLLLEQTFNINIIKSDMTAKRFFESFEKMYKQQSVKDFNPTFELNGYFYNWLCNPHNPTRVKQFAQLFQNQFNKKLWKEQHLFFLQLFKFTYWCTLLDSNHTLLKSTALFDSIRFTNKTSFLITKPFHDIISKISINTVIWDIGFWRYSIYYI